MVVLAVWVEPEPLPLLFESPQVCRLGECAGLAGLLLLLLAFAFLAFLPAFVGEPPEFGLSALLCFFGCLFGELAFLFLFREFGLLLRRVGRGALEQIGKLEETRSARASRTESCAYEERSQLTFIMSVSPRKSS